MLCQFYPSSYFTNFIVLFWRLERFLFCHELLLKYFEKLDGSRKWELVPRSWQWWCWGESIPGRGSSHGQAVGFGRFYVRKNIIVICYYRECRLLPVISRFRLPLTSQAQRWWIWPKVVQCHPDTADTDRALVITGKKRRKSREREEENGAGEEGIKRTIRTTKRHHRIYHRR